MEKLINPLPTPNKIQASESVLFNFKRRVRELTRHNGTLMAPSEIIPAAVMRRKAVRAPLGAVQSMGGAGSAAQQQ